MKRPITSAILRWSAVTILTGFGLLVAERILGLPDAVAAVVTTSRWVLMVLTVAALSIIAVGGSRPQQPLHRPGAAVVTTAPDGEIPSG